MPIKGTFTRTTAAAAALSVGLAGGYVANAAVNAGQPVNAKPAPAVTVSGLPSFAPIVERVGPAVVSIEVEGKMQPARVAQQGPRGFQPPPGFEGFEGFPFDFRQFGAPDGQDPEPVKGAGSGFFISADGYIATNNHVIDGAEKITIHTADDRTFKARVIGRDPATDIAVLKVDAVNLPYVSFEDSAKPKVGDWVVAVGNPFNLGGTATAGIVSAMGRRNLSGSSYVDYMQIDAPINRGNSGGPTFDLNGRVVGINSAIFSPSGGSVGIGFDIPADVAASVTKQLIAGGKVTRGFIGAAIQDVTPDIAESLGMPQGKGALVAKVTAGGPSDKAGLMPGDVVMKINGRDVSGASDLTRQVGLAKAGDALRLDVQRDGKPMQLTLRSGTRPAEDELADNTPTFRGNGGGDAERDTPGPLGLRLAPDADGKGVRVADLDRNSDAAQKGLRPGDVIVRAGNQATRSAGDLAQAVSQAQALGRKQVLLRVERRGELVFLPVEVGQG